MGKRIEKFWHEDNDLIRHLWENREFGDRVVIATYRIGFIQGELMIENSEDGSEKITLFGCVNQEKNGWQSDDYINFDLTDEIKKLKCWNAVKAFLFGVIKEHYWNIGVDCSCGDMDNVYRGYLPVREEFEKYMAEKDIWYKLYMNFNDDNYIHCDNAFHNNWFWKLTAAELRAQNVESIVYDLTTFPDSITEKVILETIPEVAEHIALARKKIALISEEDDDISDKKANMAYWDEIDNTSEEFVTAFLSHSVTSEQLDEDEVLEIGKEVTEFMLSKLREYGINTDTAYPYVDENY